MPKQSEVYTIMRSQSTSVAEGAVNKHAVRYAGSGICDVCITCVICAGVLRDADWQ